MVGKTLGHYEILEPLGAGGMGEVYRARDTKLDRDVAIKVLPEDFATDPDRLARFEREAKLLASLSHANIATIHGLEDSDGVRFIAMECVEGETLAQRIARAGRIEVDDALNIARQIAEALEAAHDNGVIHRDLKPANIKVKEDGTVKVLDFGLAKAIAPDPTSAAADDLSNSPTLTARATQMGVVLGTAAYMAPEQAKGKAVDKRADVWAFGVVLFEMLAGTRPFDGSDVSEVMARVIDREPDWSSLPASTPRAIERLLRRCLVKSRNDRLHDIGDARLEIDDAVTGPAGVSAEGSRDHRPATWWLVVSALVLGSLVAAVAAWALWPKPGTLAVTRFEHALTEGLDFRRIGWRAIALSRDGRQVVYNTAAGLFLFTMDDPEARLIPGTEGDMSGPFFSPDGLSIGYWDVASAQLKRIATTGGTGQSIAPVTDDPFGASWEPDGTILFGQPGGIFRVPEGGGPPELVIQAKEGEWAFGPQLLPDGHSVLFAVTTALGRWGDEAAEIVVQSLRTGARTQLGIKGSDARYLATGQLVYAFENALYAVAFDPDRPAVVGESKRLAEGVYRATSTGIAFYAVADDGGALAYVKDATDPGRRLVWVDRAGQPEPLRADPRAYHSPRISPDGTRAVVSIGDSAADIWTWDFATELPANLTSSTADDQYPLWLDDTRVVFSSDRDGPRRLYWISADGAGSAEPLTQGEQGRTQYPQAVSADGSRLVFRESTPSDGWDLRVVSLDGDHQEADLISTEFDERNAALSPDGWMAFQSDRSGLGIYVAAFPDVGIPLGPVARNGRSPVWARDGRELFYRDANRFMHMTVDSAPDFDPGPATELFNAAGYYNEPTGRGYDVAPDGRFLMIAGRMGQTELRINIVLNWFEDLKRLAPTGGSR